MNSKRVLIVTLPLGGNYGGILQAYALQRILKGKGLDVYTTTLPVSSRWKETLRPVYSTIRRLQHLIQPSKFYYLPDLLEIEESSTRSFVDRYITCVNGDEAIRQTQQGRYDAIIVGSDQVWRRAYTSIERNLLDFSEGIELTRLSYAASFGHDNLSEYGTELINRSAKLAKAFDAISVREDSGLELVQNYWGMEAEHHVDPTMLLDDQHYLDLIRESPDVIKPSNGNLFTYILDPSKSSSEGVTRIGEILGLDAFGILSPKASSRAEFLSDPGRFKLAPVTQWLRSFADSEFIVTDSFHGTVMSILFHKPFIAIGNLGRGMTRFESLLRIFDLEERLVDSAASVTDGLLQKPIDWGSVDDKLRIERKRALEFLSMYLEIE